MSNTSLTCPRCRARLEKGFTLDQNGAHRRESTFWASGDYWSFMLGQEKVLPIETWRCPECGMLQNFAHEIKLESRLDTTVDAVLPNSDRFVNSDSKNSDSETCSAVGK